MFKFVPSSVVSRIVILCLFMIFIAVAAVGGLNYTYVRSDILNTAKADAREAIRTMGLLYELELPGSKTEVREGHVTRVIRSDGGLPNHDLVDRTASAIGGVATVFDKKAGDYVRVSTNVKTEKGERAIGTKLAADHPAQSYLARGEAYFGPALLFGKDYMTGYFPITDSSNAVAGVLFVGIPMEFYFTHINTSAQVVAGSAIAAMIVLGLVGFLALRRLLRPLEVLTGTIHRLSDADDSADIPYVDRKNEFGNIARALELFRDAGREKKAMESLRAEELIATEAERQRHDAERQRTAAQIDLAVGELGNALSRLSQGDLSTTIETEFSGQLEKLRTDFNGSIIRLRETMSNIRGSTLAIQKSSADLSQSSADLSKRTETQAASLEETAAAVDEITATVRSSAERAREANHAVSVTKVSADGSGVVVSNAVAAMGRIEEASGKIESIIEVIDDIAFQTNLLALNAGIEAARAGEAGKGFAVVAQEVRELAQRSAEAAREIKDLINQSSREVSSGSELVQQAGDVLADISRQITGISQHVDMIATASQDQSAALQDINNSVNRMDQMTQQNGAMVGETTDASRRLADEADALLQLVQQFRIDATTRSAYSRAA